MTTPFGVGSRRRAVLGATLAALLVNAAPGDLGTSVVRPAGLPADWDVEPLGWVRVTNYSHVETRSRVTSSGYVLRDEDEGLVCAISRDWWRSRVRDGDLVWVPGFAQPCAALDTMALANRKGLAQTRWIDIYVNDRGRGLDFGIQRSSAYLVRPPAGSGLVSPSSVVARLRGLLGPAWTPPPALGREPSPGRTPAPASPWAERWAGMGR